MLIRHFRSPLVISNLICRKRSLFQISFSLAPIIEISGIVKTFSGNIGLYHQKQKK